MYYNIHIVKQRNKKERMIVMRNYKGYYIDGVHFKCESDIDSFIRDRAVKSFKQAMLIFYKDSTLEASIYCDKRADVLRGLGFTPEQIEDIELDVLYSMES